MKKALLIGIKDLKVAARDRAALVLMLAAPFVLTLGMGLITGNLGGGDTQTGLQNIPVLLVDHDGGDLSQALVEAFTSPELEDLIEATQTSDESTARSAVEEDTVAAAVIIPAGFGESIIPTESGQLGDAVSIEIYANPARPISSGVVEAIVQQFLGRVESARIAGEVAVTQLLQDGLITPQEAPALGRQIGSQAAISPDEAPVSLAVENPGEQEREEEAFNPLAVLAPGMAIFFLMYTVTYGGTRLLNERNEWTLQRLLTT
ncbi:MAG: ABC transporter permease, partial [Chloroflexota bacterium]